MDTDRCKEQRGWQADVKEREALGETAGPP